MPQLKEDPTQGTAATPAPDFELSRLAIGRPAHPLWQRLADHPFDDPRDALELFGSAPVAARRCSAAIHRSMRASAWLRL